MIGLMGRAALAASVSLLALTGARAGGLTNASQSAVFNGMAYAGFAAPGSESPATMFMNPATMTGFTRLTIDANATFGLPSTRMKGAYSGTGLGAALAPGLNALPGSSGNAGMDYFVPTTYVVYPLTDRFTIGLAINPTYGNSLKPDEVWRGSVFAHTSKLRIVTATPSIAYKINEQWSVGFGLQLQHASARQYGLPPAALGGPQAGILHADGFGVGWTAGITYKPTATTQIGLGWRSFIDQKVSGKVISSGTVADGVDGTLNLPNRLNLSLRQGINEQFDLLASVEWQNYGRIGDAALKNLPATPATMATLRRLPFGYSDSWMFALGGEYRYNRDLTLRAGIAYEISPVTDAVRRVSLPDNDRLWLSTGLSYKFMDRFALNASYSYLFIKKAPISTTVGLAPGSALTFTGDSRGHAHLLSVGLTAALGEPPVREAAIVRKY